MAYQVHLKQFDGPLDLLLHLIEQAEVDIKDIFISEITTQYLAYMAQVDELDMDTASEFLTMAATLVYIKSRSLLPRPPKEEEEGEDPAETLIRQLREYKAIKLAGQRLQELEQAARGMYAKLPEEFLLPPQEVVWEGGTREGLFETFLELLHKRELAQENAIQDQEVRADTFTVRTQLGKLRNLLREKSQVEFWQLFPPNTCKLEMIVTFMALLDMLTRGEVHIQQNQPYAPIRILRGNLLGEDDQGATYMDEE